MRMVPANGVPVSSADVLAVFGRLVTGSDGAGFVDAFAGRMGTRHAFATGSGRSALYLGLRVFADMRPGRRDVLVPEVTCPSVIAAVRRAGLRPVLYPVDRATLGPDAEGIRNSITGDTLCVVAGGLFGIPGDMPGAAVVARDQGVFLLEDAAQSFGTSWDGRPAGTFGHISVFSFGKSKHLSTVDGGMACTGDGEICDRMAELHAALPQPALPGTVRRMALFLAAAVMLRPLIYRWASRLAVPGGEDGADFPVRRMGRFQRIIGGRMLQSVDEMNACRRRNAELLLGLPGIKRHFCELPHGAAAGSFTYLRLPLILKKSENGRAVRRSLARAGVWPYSRMYAPLYCLTGSPDGTASAGLAELLERIVIFPVHPYLGEHEFKRIDTMLDRDVL